MKKSSGSPVISPVMRELASYIAAAHRKPLPATVMEKTKHHVLDTLAAMVSGSTLLPGKMALAYVKTLGGRPEATVVGTKYVTNAVNAALANGMQAHADETDDSHARSLLHPGCGIVSAALAMGERERGDGNAFLRAVALGYDVGTRLTMALGGVKFMTLGHLTHCFGGTFGAAAASASLARLTAEQVRHTLSYSAQQACGLSSYPRDLEHIEKAFDFGGMAARNGVTAATMVAVGCTAVDDIFSGDRNLFMAFDESKRSGFIPKPELLVHELGKTYEIMHTNIKRWSVGSPIQAPLDSLLTLIREHDIHADDVEELVVRVYAGGARTADNRKMPDINMQYMCAVMLLDGYASFEAAHDRQRMGDPRVRALAKRIKLIADEELERLRPEKHAIVDMTLKDGRKFHHHTRAVRGTAQNPMPREEVDEKCYSLMAPVLGKKRARALCDAIWKTEEIKDVLKLRSLLQN